MATILDCQEMPTLYTKDSKYVYYEGVIVAGADPGSYEDVPLSNTGNCSDYFKDKSQVYFMGSALPLADPRTFSAYVLEEEGGDNEYGIDKDNVFFDGAQILGADALTFISYNYAQSCGLGCVFTARDKTHLYFEDRIVTPPK